MNERGLAVKDNFVRENDGFQYRFTTSSHDDSYLLACLGLDNLLALPADRKGRVENASMPATSTEAFKAQKLEQLIEALAAVLSIGCASVCGLCLMGRLDSDLEAVFGFGL